MPLALRSTALGMAAMMLGGCQPAGPVPPIAPGLAESTRTGELPSGIAPVMGQASRPAPRPTKVVPPADTLKLPPQMTISVFASGLEGVHDLAFSPSGDLFATQPGADRVVVLPDDDGDGVADQTLVFAEGAGISWPSGILFVEGHLFIGNTDSLTRFDHVLGDRRPPRPGQLILALPGLGQAPHRPLAQATDGSILVGIGASCTVCDETDERRASVLSVPADGSRDPSRVARGLHAPQGLAVNPKDGTVWLSEAGRDGLGPGLPPDEINLILPGQDYGWPRCFGNGLLDGTVADDPSACVGTAPPAISLPAHVSPAGLTFTTRANLAPEYANGLLVALPGTAGGDANFGASLVFLPFDAGGPIGEVQPFISGWHRSDGTRWGRPTDVEIGSDGAVYIADEGAGVVYRAFYRGRYATPTPPFSER